MKIGETVSWICKPHLGKPFLATGIIKKIGVSTFGSKKKATSICVSTTGEYLKVFPNRFTTTISIDKIFKAI